MSLPVGLARETVWSLRLSGRRSHSFRGVDEFSCNRVSDYSDLMFGSDVVYRE